MSLTVYLAGQIHDDWRGRLIEQASDRGVDVNFVSPQDDHPLSDAIGVNVLGEESKARWKDELASQFNNLRTRVLMQKSDVVVAQFGEEYRQWNAAMDAGIAIALDKPLILVRDPKPHHALKEISQRAQVTVDHPDQVLDALEYILK